MGLFRPNYLKPGPGVDPNAPRKKGYARFLELLGRDFPSYFKAGLLALLGAVPFLAGTAMAVSAHALLPMLAAGALGGMLAGPQICGLADTILRSLRDEPGFWWHTYKRAWKRSAAASLLPGAVCGVAFAGQIFLLFHAAALDLTGWQMLPLLVSPLLTLGLCGYLWPQVALMELSFPVMLYNCVLILLRNPVRTLAAAAIQMVYWAVVLLFFPLSLIALPLTSFWLPMLPALQTLYGPLEASFFVEQRLKERQ